jgi:ABC-type multidrug transport system ATPase subunit
VTGIAFDVDGLMLEGPRGLVYSGVAFAAEPGQLVAVAGRGGSGRTSLLLTLAGRMKPTAGSARVGGHALPQEAAAVRRLVSVGRAGGAVELDEHHRVAETIALRGVLRGRRIAPGEAGETLSAAGIEPDPDALVGDLPPATQTLLAVALAALERPPATVFDDADRGAGGADERAVWLALRGLADGGVTVIASTTDPAAARGIADHVVALG